MNDLLIVDCFIIYVVIGLFQSAWLISTIGILNCLGRIAVGFVSDKSWADCILINIMALVAGGCTTMFVPLYRYYWILLLYTIVFGTCIGN